MGWCFHIFRSSRAPPTGALGAAVPALRSPLFPWSDPPLARGFLLGKQGQRKHRYPYWVPLHATKQPLTTTNTAMQRELNRESFTHTIQAEVWGQFDMKDLRAQAQAFAQLTGSVSPLDQEAHVKVFAEGEWETAEGDPVTLNSGNTMVQKIGRKYLHVSLLGPDGMEPTRIVPAHNFEGPRVLIQEGTAGDHTEGVGSVN